MANQYTKSNMLHIDVPNVSGVYLITDTTSERTYVGSAKKIRQRVSLHFNDMQRRPEQASYKNFATSFKKYGARVFSVRLLEECPVNDLLNREKKWIAALNPTENSYVCSDGRKVYSDATRQRKSEIVSALWKNEEYRKKAVAARLGNTFSKGYKCTPEQIENRKRAARISNMKRKYKDEWKKGYLEWYPEHREDVL